MPYCCASTKTSAPVGSADCTSAPAAHKGSMVKTWKASHQVISGWTSSLRNTSHDTSVMPAVGDLPTMKRPMAKSAQGPAEAPRMSQKVPTACGSGTPRPDTSRPARSEEHTSELQSLMRISYAVFCLKKKKPNTNREHYRRNVTRTGKLDTLI